MMFLEHHVVVALIACNKLCMACSGGQADNHEKIDYTVLRTKIYQQN